MQINKLYEHTRREIVIGVEHVSAIKIVAEIVVAAKVAIAAAIVITPWCIIVAVVVRCPGSFRIWAIYK